MGKTENISSLFPMFKHLKADIILFLFFYQLSEKPPSRIATCSFLKEYSLVLVTISLEISSVYVWEKSVLLSLINLLLNVKYGIYKKKCEFLGRKNNEELIKHEGTCFDNTFRPLSCEAFWNHYDMYSASVVIWYAVSYFAMKYVMSSWEGIKPLFVCIIKMEI